ncbi:MAG: lysophospholipid acyltransferase family protein [Deltaproteobacteria bacterium]|nr:lysophospholipid acyltransferase family protein [Deltaproteobacteria bacterium]
MPPSANIASQPADRSEAKPVARHVSTTRWLVYSVWAGLWRLLVQIMRVTPPHRFMRLFAPVLRCLTLCAVSRRRIVALMDAAFGDAYTLAAKRGLARGVQQRIAENVLDCLVQMGYPERLRGVLDVQGQEHLEAALAKGRGAIALSFHLGNFVLLTAAMGVAGYPVHILLRVLDDERLWNLVLHHSRSFFTELIPSFPRREAVKRLLGVLRDNGTVVMLADNLKRGELETTLFGQPVRTARGVVSLALRTRAPVLPVFLVRSYSGRLRLVIEPEMEMERTGDLSADLAANTGRIMRLLEDLVRRYPDQWYWLTAKLPRRSRPRAPKDVA